MRLGLRHRSGNGHGCTSLRPRRRPIGGRRTTCCRQYSEAVAGRPRRLAGNSPELSRSQAGQGSAVPRGGKAQAGSVSAVPRRRHRGHRHRCLGSGQLRRARRASARAGGPAGFTFRARGAQQDRVKFRSFLPAISTAALKKISGEIRCRQPCRLGRIGWLGAAAAGRWAGRVPGAGARRAQRRTGVRVRRAATAAHDHWFGDRRRPVRNFRQRRHPRRVPAGATRVTAESHDQEPSGPSALSGPLNLLKVASDR